MKKFFSLIFCLFVGLNIVFCQDVDPIAFENELNEEKPEISDSLYVSDIDINSETDEVNILNEGETVEIQVQEDNDKKELELEIFEWNNVKTEGKLKMAGLPMSPGLRIYMTRDSLIDLSIRVPLMGEIGRVIIISDSILAINKLNKTYMSESYGNIKGIGISEVQKLLLAQFFLPAINFEDVELDEVAEIFYEDEQYNVVPKGIAKIAGVKYGFVVDSGFNPQMIVILPENRPDLEINVEYTYFKKGYDITFIMTNGSDEKKAILELKEPEWEVEMPKPTEITKNYRKVDLSDFMKGIMR